MKIFIDARYLDGSYTGIGTYSLQLVEHLSRIDTVNQYYVLVRAGFKGPLVLGENFKILEYPHAPISTATLFKLGGLVDSLGVDLMHSLFPVAPLKMKTPLMVTVHDLQPFLDPEFSARRPLLLQYGYNLFYRSVYPAVLRKAKWVVNVSYYTRDSVAELFPDFIPKLIVVPSGLDKAHFQPPDVPFAEIRRTFQLERPYLLYYGSTRPNKNLPMVVKGFARYIRNNHDPETELVLILKKDRFYRDINRAIRIEGIGARVRVFDQVTHTERRAILGQARAFVFASKYEGFGFPALEAMAAGVPVIAGRSGALAEVCSDCAHLVDVDSADSIADAMAVLLTDDELRQKSVEKGMRRAGLYDWTESATRIHDIYRLLV